MNTFAKRAVGCVMSAAALHALSARALAWQASEPKPDAKSETKSDTKSLQERVEALEKKLESSDTMRSYWNRGLKFESADKNFTFGVDGRIHFDSEFNQTEKDLEQTNVYNTPGNSTVGSPGGPTNIGGQTNDWEIRRARINLNGKLYQHFEFVDQFDFAGGGNGGNGVQQKDVYVGAYNLGDWIPDVRAGQFYEPMGLDQMTSDNDMAMLEFAAPTNAFLPGRSPGFMLRKAMKDDKIERFTWAAGIFRPDSGDNGVGAKGTGGYALTGRLTGLPWYDNGNLLHVGIAASERSLAAAPTTGGASATPTLTFSSNPEAHLMSTMISTGAIPADGELKLDGELAWIYDAFSFQSEYYIDKVDVASGSAINNPTFTGYYAQVAYTLTGERRPWKGADAFFGGITPSHNAFVNGGMGAWEVALRWSNVDLTDGSLATGVRGGSVDVVTLGLNWYANNSVRVMWDLSRADVNTDDPGLGQGGVTNILQMRVQVAF
jgi:phosphate-selective porin OprO/OprP